MKKKACTACGAPSLKRIRAVIVRSETAPKIGLVCQHCARCGMLVVPGALKLIPAKPRKVPRGAFVARVGAGGVEWFGKSTESE